MRSSSDFDRNNYPFTVQFTGATSYYVTDVRKQEKVFDAGAGQPARAATDYAREHNAAYWTKVDAGQLATA